MAPRGGVEADGERLDEREFSEGKPIGSDQLARGDGDPLAQRPVALHAERLVRRAAICSPGNACGALAATGVRHHEHIQSRPPRIADARAQRFDRRGDLVPRHPRIRHKRVGAAVGAQVGAAETDRATRNNTSRSLIAGSSISTSEVSPGLSMISARIS